MKISIAGREIEEGDEGTEPLLQTAHDQKIRPLCLCRKPHPQLQIAHIADHYFVKRLPRDAGAHALQCERFEIPLSLSGKVASAGKSIIDDQKSDGVEIKLAVALQPGKRVAPAATGAPASNTVKAVPARLSLFGLLNYLWEEAGLCEMHPHYKGRRFWGVVSNRLNAALCGKTSKTFSYDHIAYIPAQFDPAHPAANGRARLAKTHRAIGDHHRMIFIGEFKELTQGKFGPVLKLKHVDCAITVADDLKRRMQSRFKAEFAACGANSRIHLMACCLVDFNKAGYPSLAEIGFLTVSPEWLPFSSEAEAMLIQSLIEGGRSFTKTLRYDLPDEATIAAAILKDVGAEGVALFLDDGSHAGALRQALEDCPMPTWVWNILEPMPPLPKARVQAKEPEPLRSQTDPLRPVSPPSPQVSSAWRR